MNNPMESRIALEDNAMSSLIKMAEGNPGAAEALMQLFLETEKIDPQAMFGGLGTILSLDTHRIYGTEIYILYNDKCNRDIRRMILLLRAVQLGLFSESRLKEMAKDQERKINLLEEEWLEIDTKVCDCLKDFQRPVGGL